MRARGALAVTALGVLSIVTSACGSSTARAQSHETTSRTTATTSTSVAKSTTTRVRTTPSSTSPPSYAVATTAPPTTVAPTPTTAAVPVPLFVTQLTRVGSAQQVIAVAASGYGTSTATLTAYEHGVSGWTQVFGPWEANIGRNGVAPAGAKREGDGRTPSGVYGFDFMFGVNPNPGVHFPFRPITSSNIVWDDDPASANYNEWIDTNTTSAGAGPEPMDVGAYGSASAAPSSCTCRRAGRPPAACRSRAASCFPCCAGSTPPAVRASRSGRSAR